MKTKYICCLSVFYRYIKRFCIRVKFWIMQGQFNHSVSFREEPSPSWCVSTDILNAPGALSHCKPITVDGTIHQWFILHKDVFWEYLRMINKMSIFGIWHQVRKGKIQRQFNFQGPIQRSSKMERLIPTFRSSPIMLNPSKRYEPFIHKSDGIHLLFRWSLRRFSSDVDGSILNKQFRYNLEPFFSWLKWGGVPRDKAIDYFPCLSTLSSFFVLTNRVGPQDSIRSFLFLSMIRDLSFFLNWEFSF